MKRSVSIRGHRTSYSLEPEFQACLDAMAAEQGIRVAVLVARIDAGRGDSNLSSALRVAILNWALTRNADH